MLKTKTHSDGDKNPVWNQELDYKVKNMSEAVKIEIWSERMFGNESVGTGSFEIADFCHEGEISYSISHEEEQAGTIRFETNWISFHAAKDRLRRMEEAKANAANAVKDVASMAGSLAAAGEAAANLKKFEEQKAARV